MKKPFGPVAAYALLGLISGMASRAYLNDMHFDGESQLNLLHFHLFVLGMVMMLVWLALDGVFRLSREAKLFNLAFWHYNGGVVLTLVGMVIIGVQQAGGVKDLSPMLSGISGLP